MDKKEQILKCARELFMRQGISETSVREITEASHIAKGTFYLYFKDKKALIHELWHQEVLLLTHHATLDLNDTTHYQTHMVSFFNAIVEECIAHPEILVFVRKHLDSREIKEYLTTISDSQKELIHQSIIDYLVRSGFEREDAVIRMVLAMQFTIIACYGSIILNQPAPITVLRSYILNGVYHFFERGNHYDSL